MSTLLKTTLILLKMIRWEKPTTLRNFINRVTKVKWEKINRQLSFNTLWIEFDLPFVRQDCKTIAIFQWYSFSMEQVDSLTEWSITKANYPIVTSCIKMSVDECCRRNRWEVKYLKPKIKPSPDLTRHTERHTLFIYLEVGVGVRCVCVWKDRSRFHCDPVSTKLIPS